MEVFVLVGTETFSSFIEHFSSNCALANCLIIHHYLVTHMITWKMKWSMDIAKYITLINTELS